MAKSILWPEALVYVTSSNVRGADYDEISGELIVQYKGGEVWAYKLHPDQAAAFFLAGSKGEWLWSNVKVRGKGNRHMHRVPARRLA